MANFETKDIRNIAFVGHGGSGKTSLCEAILFDAGKNNRIGSVDQGTTLLDYLPEEIEKKISLRMALAQFEHKGKKINIIDTPGYNDFIGDAVASLRAVDSVVIPVSADDGIQFFTIDFYKKAVEMGLSVIFFINKLDKENVKFDKIFDDISKLTKMRALPVEIPVGSGEGLNEYINLINMKMYKRDNVTSESKESDIRDDVKDQADKYREKLVEAVAESDDTLTEKYLEEGTLSEEEISAGIAKSLSEKTIYPVLAGSAIKNLGISMLLNFITERMPSPADRKVKANFVDSDEELDVSCKTDGPLSGFIFKSASVPHIGEIMYMRLFSGSVKTGEDVFNSGKSKTERVGQINYFIGKEKMDVNQVIAGDICALIKLKDTETSNTLCAASRKIKFPELSLPHPVYEMALVPKTKADQEKMSTSLNKLVQEDPTMRVVVEPELHQTIIKGMGDQQIDNLVHQLERRSGVHVELVKPRIPYRETIKKSAKAQGRYKKQTGGHGQFGDCWIEIEPLKTGEEFEFVNKIFGGSIPTRFIPSVEKGVKDTLKKGILAGYKMINIKVTLYDGSFHSVDSSDLAFQVAGSLALKNAAPNASLTLLEPIMKVKVVIPEKYMGDTISDLNSRRGRVLGMDDDGEFKIINVNIPQESMYKYSNDLRSITQGTGTFFMEFDHYEEVPKEQAQKIIDESKKEEE